MLEEATEHVRRIAGQPAFRADVELVEAELLRRRDLTGEDIDQILDEATHA